MSNHSLSTDTIGPQGIAGASKTDVSLIIVNWNTRDILRDSLCSIYKQAGTVTFEIIVVDNASTDGSAQMVKSEFPDVRLIENTENKGYGAAANQAIKITEGRYVLILNSDIIFCDAVVDKTVKYADANPEAAVITCQVWQSGETVQMTCFKFPSVLNLLLLGSGLAGVFKHNRFFGRERMLWWDRNSNREVDVASGMFLLVRRKAVEKVGMMDESFFLYYEETDWCRRFVNEGWNILFWPGAKVLHLDGGGKSSPGKDSEMFARQRKSMLLYFKKHHGWSACLMARLILSVSYGMRFCIWNMILLLKHFAGASTAKAKEECRKCWGVVKICIAEKA